MFFSTLILHLNAEFHNDFSMYAAASFTSVFPETFQHLSA